MSGLVAAPLLRGDEAAARENAKTYREIFGDRFYIEVMRHGMPEQDAINGGLVRIARELGRADRRDQRFALPRAKGRFGPRRAALHRNGQDGLRYQPDEVLLRSVLCEVARRDARALERPSRGLRKHDARSPSASIFGSPKRSFICRSSTFRRMPARPRRATRSYLRELCEHGLRERYGEERAATDPALRERLEYELAVITKMGFSSYFLIVWDFIKYARDRGIPVGPGRGSAVGSLVAYCLKITDLDPLRFNLLFERFLEPRAHLDAGYRHGFLRRAARRSDRVRHGKIRQRSRRADRDLRNDGRARRDPRRGPSARRAATRRRPHREARTVGPGGLTISRAIEQIPELNSIYATRPEIRKLLDTAKEIEGLARNAGTHAAGVVISAGPLIEYTPLVRFGDGGINTQYDMDWIERIGLLKMDFLGLRNLTVMENAAREIRRTVDESFDLAKIPIDDPKTFEMLGRGETMGVFQLESEGMKRVCAELQPSRFEDIVALVALYRPGPMDWIPQYIANKHGRSTPQLPAPEARADSRRDLRNRRLSRTGDADGARHCGLHDERSRRAAQGHGEEAEGEDSVLSREVRLRSDRYVGHRSRARRADIPFRRALRRLRLQQIARGGVRMDCASNRVS